MSIANRLRAFRYVAALVPAVALLVVALLVSRQSFHQVRVERVTDHAQLVAANVDLTMRRLLDLTTFCTSAPALLERVDLQSVRENCGRYATQIGGWLVIVETGETHRQILNTLTDASAELPVYPRSDELPTLRALEARSRSSGEAGIAEVFTGIIRQEGIVSAGQHVRLADGRDAMLYVSVRARSLSDQLAELAEPQGLVLGLIDASKRVVARSDGIDRMMFAPAPEWLHGDMEARRPGVALEMRGPQTVNGLWDVGYQPLEVAPGWMAVAVQPSQVGLQLWAPLSLPSAVTLAGFLVSALLYWGILRGDQAARRIEAARRAELEAKRQDQDKSRLLASFAHDIRSPLISLIGSLEMIGYGRNAAEADVRAALRAAESLLQLVDDILELSFLGSGEMSLHPSPVDVGQVAAGLCEQNRSIADRKGIVLQLDLDEELPPVVELDRLRKAATRLRPHAKQPDLDARKFHRSQQRDLHALAVVAARQDRLLRLRHVFRLHRSRRPAEEVGQPDAQALGQREQHGHRRHALGARDLGEHRLGDAHRLRQRRRRHVLVHAVGAQPPSQGVAQVAHPGVAVVGQFVGRVGKCGIAHAQMLSPS